jgi:uncharacterized spore protein YtfJ
MSSSQETLTAAVHDIAEMIEHEGSVRAVFGPPTKLETRTIIPVASVALGGGGGGMGSLGAAIDGLRRRFLGGVTSNWLSAAAPKPREEPGRTFVGGGGGGLDVRPVGFICEEDGRVVFRRIDTGEG